MNDAPVVNEDRKSSLSSIGWALSQYFLPHVPNDISNYEGFLVENLANDIFQDNDDLNHDLGLAILGAQSHNSSMGEYTLGQNIFVPALEIFPH